MAIENQDGDYDLDVAAPGTNVYSKTAAADGQYAFELRVGDGTKSLHTDGGTLTMTVTVASQIINGGGEAVTVAAGSTRVTLRTPPVFIASGESITIALLSSNSNDDDVDVKVYPRAATGQTADVGVVLGVSVTGAVSMTLGFDSVESTGFTKFVSGAYSLTYDGEEWIFQNLTDEWHATTLFGEYAKSGGGDTVTIKPVGSLWGLMYELPAAVAAQTDIAAGMTAIVHADYGLAQLVRSTTPANKLTVDTGGRIRSNTSGLILKVTKSGSGPWLPDLSGYYPESGATSNGYRMFRHQASAYFLGVLTGGDLGEPNPTSWSIFAVTTGYVPYQIGPVAGEDPAGDYTHIFTGTGDYTVEEAWSQVGEDADTAATQATAAAADAAAAAEDIASLFDGTRPDMKLGQLSCICNIADEGAIHAYNSDPEGYGVLHKGQIGQANIGTGSDGLYNVALVSGSGIRNTGVSYGVQNSGVVSDVVGFDPLQATQASAATAATQATAAAGDAAAAKGYAKTISDLVSAGAFTAAALVNVPVSSEVTTALALLTARFCGTHGKVVYDSAAGTITVYQAGDATPLFTQSVALTSTKQTVNAAT